MMKIYSSTSFRFVFLFSFLIFSTGIVIAQNNVGIGIATPAEKLDVDGTTQSEAFKASINGTATLPAFHFLNSTGTGMFLPSTNELGFTTAGTRQLSISNIGIVNVRTLMGTGTRVVTVDAAGNLGFRNEFSAGSGISIVGGVINNTASNQPITVGGGTGISISGSYPNFTVTNTAPTPANNVVGNGTLNYVAKWTPNGSTLGNSQIFDNGTNVGIGLTSPGEKLHVNGDLRLGSNGGINTTGSSLKFMYGVRAVDGAYEWVGYYSGTTRQGIILYDGPWSGANNLSNEFSITAENNNILSLNTNSNHIALMPKGSGYVGIGTTSPAHPFHVTKGISGNWQARFTNGNSNVYLAHETGYGMHINTGAANSSGRYALEVRNASQTHMYVRDDGNVGIGTTAPIHRLHVNGSTFIPSGQSYWIGSGTDAGDRLRMHHTSANGYIDYASQSLFFRPNGNAQIVFTNQGRVGINNMAPNANGYLDVNGISYFGDWGTCGTSNRISAGWYLGCDPTIHPEINAWGYSGTSALAWFRTYSYGFVNASRRELKRNITPVSGNVSEFVMNDIDKLQPYFYKYKNEEESANSANPNRYRPQMHLGLIVDESPDYLQDEAFSGIDIYAVATMAVAGVKHNRSEIKQLQQSVNKTAAIQQDFGTATMQGTEFWITYSDEFKAGLKGAEAPVISLTPNQFVQLIVTEKNSDGFKVESQQPVQNLKIDWLAINKAQQVAAETPMVAESEIPAELHDQLVIDESRKQQIQSSFISISTGGKQ